MRKHSNSLDVAKLAGVSQTTVSFVLNQRRGHSISTETRERVLKAAEELQYRSNRLSNGVLRGDTGLIGYVSPLISDDYYAYILSAVSVGCAAAGETVVFSPFEDHAEVQRDPLLPLLEYRVDGVVCVCQTVASELEAWIDEILQKGIRCVVVDDRQFEKSVHCVVSDDLAGSRMVVEHLASLGHRKIAHLSAGDKSSTAIERRAGFVEGMKALGVSESELIIEGVSYGSEDARIAARKIFGHRDRPTAIVAANDRLAAEAIKELTSLGLRCPEDVSVAGYGNTQGAKSFDLTSVDQQPDKIGLAAIKSLHDQKAGLTEVQPATVLDCFLMKRSTTGPCKAG